MCDLHFKLDKDQTTTTVAIEDERYFRQTDRHSSDFITVQCHELHWTDNKLNNAIKQHSDYLHYTQHSYRHDAGQSPRGNL